jgi:hypothetical protein
MPHASVTPGEYWSQMQLLTTEIEDAITIHYTYEEINRLALHDEAILTALNRDSLFWKTQMYCLQTSLFITLSRIFDTGPKAKTIRKLISDTLGHLELFSATALAARNTNGGQNPERLDEYMAEPWVPASADDLRHLKRALKPYASRFRQVYEPIRHAMFAHRLMSNVEAGATLFQDTNREEVSVMLDFLRDLIDAISNLYLYGRKPELGTRSYKDHNQRIRDGVSAVLKRLPDA